MNKELKPVSGDAEKTRTVYAYLNSCNRFQVRTTAACLAVLACLVATSSLGSYVEELNKAAALRNAGHIEEALAAYNDIQSEYSDTVTNTLADMLVGRGFCYLRSIDKDNEALSDFRQVIKATSTYVDAYYGVVLVMRRKGRLSQIGRTLEQCEKACSGHPKKLRRLAAIAWQQQQFPLARRLDSLYTPAPDRKLISNPWSISLKTSYYNLKRRDDWYAVQPRLQLRMRPDLSAYIRGKQCWRYGREATSGGLGLSYRPTMRTSLGYKGDTSLTQSFLPDQKHAISAGYRLLRNTRLSCGVNLRNYDSDWSKRAVGAIKQQVLDMYAKGRYSGGEDAHGKSVGKYAASLGYQNDRFLLEATYSNGDETVEIAKKIGFIYREDIVKSFSVYTSYKLNEAIGINARWLYETREDELFRNGFTLGMRYSF